MKKEFNYKTIKTFEDACKKLDIEPDDINDKTIPSWLKATWKLEIIFKAINDGWEPDWNNSNEYKWHPYFRMPSVSFGGSGCDFWLSDAVFRLYTYNNEISDYIGKTFEDLYREAFLIG